MSDQTGAAIQWKAAKRAASFCRGLAISELQESAFLNSRSKGFHDGAMNIGEKLALIHSEISEALECYRNHPEHIADIYIDNRKPEGFGVELADAVIRIADLCGAIGVDLEEMIRLKHEYNTTRPYRHGGKSC
jgi:hypothetical protein